VSETRRGQCLPEQPAATPLPCNPSDRRSERRNYFTIKPILRVDTPSTGPNSQPMQYKSGVDNPSIRYFQVFVLENTENELELDLFSNTILRP
jgi:hypothetical protein